MRSRVAGRIQHLELYGAAHLDHIAARESSIHTADSSGRAGMREHTRVRSGDDAGVAIGVIAMLVRVQDLRDAEATGTRRRQALRRVERIDDQRFAGFVAGDEVVEVTQRIRRPDAFDVHGAVSRLISGPQSLIEQPVLRLERHADAHGGAFADDGMNVDAAAHEFQAFTDVEKSEATLARGQPIDGMHFEANPRVDDIERQ